MAEFPALPLWTDAYLGDTNHLTTIEHGAYFLLLMAMWRSPGCRLPNDDVLLARYARLTAGQWKRIKPILWPFFRVSPDSITQGRLTDEATLVRQKRKSASDNARARWLKNKDTANADASVSDSDCNTTTATATATATEKERERAESPAPVLVNGNGVIQAGEVHPLQLPVSGPPKPPKSQKRRMPEDFALNDALQAYAVGRGISVTRVADVFEHFRDHHRKMGSVFLDWDAAWRTWCRNEAKFNPAADKSERKAVRV